MIPILKLSGDGKEHSLDEAIVYVSALFELTDDERIKLFPSGLQPVIDNRVSWARTYLRKAGLIQPTRIAHFRITERDLKVLKENPSKKCKIFNATSWQHRVSFRLYQLSIVQAVFL